MTSRPCALAIAATAASFVVSAACAARAALAHAGLSVELMPIDQFPAASRMSTPALGFPSSVFDPIALTALAIKQGACDWGFVACALGFGGAMTWFVWSAGVALSSMFAQARATGLRLRQGWFNPVGCPAGCFVLLAVHGFHPGTALKGSTP